MADSAEPRIPKDVQKKLILFSIGILSLPLIVFFTLRSYGANALLSGGSAALVANFLLIAYVFVAMTEKGPSKQELKSKKRD